MITDKQLESLIQQVTDLPQDAQTELLRSLAEMQSQNFAIYDTYDEVESLIPARRPKSD